MRTLQLSLILAFNISIGYAQQNTTQSESDRVKLEHAQIGIVEDNSTKF